jgi:ornithine cyclodeaminase
MTGPRYLDAADVRRALDPDSCIKVVREAMRAFSAEATAQPLRQILPLGEGRLFGTMPGSINGGARFGAKLISVFTDPDRPGHQRHRGVIALFGGADGAPLAIIDAETVTELRTAAASAVATDALARADARTLGLFGCGLQAAAHLRAIRRVRALDQVLVWGRDRARAEAFAQQMQSETGLPVTAVARGGDAAQADILCTVTTAALPVLEAAWVRPGTHVNAVGSSHAGPREVDRALVVAARFIADSRAGVLAQGAEFLEAKQAGAIGDDHVVGEIGEVLLGRVPGRTAADEITLYKSLGHIVQDLAAAAFLYDHSQGAAA